MDLTSDLDRFSSGLRKIASTYPFKYDRCHTIIGSSRTGKTTWVMQLLCHLVKKDNLFKHILYFSPMSLSEEQTALINDVLPEGVLFQHFLFCTPPTTHELSQLVEVLKKVSGGDGGGEEEVKIAYILDDYLTAMGVKAVNNAEVEYGGERYFHKDTRTPRGIKKKLIETYEVIFANRADCGEVEKRRAISMVKPTMGMLTNQNSHHLGLTTFIISQSAKGQDKDLASVLRGGSVFVFKWDSSSLTVFKSFLKSIGIALEKVKKILATFRIISSRHTFSTMVVDDEEIRADGRYKISFNPFTKHAEYVFV